ncbi:MAG TPA: hypothetical protein VNP98_16900 [Chthoniobacterales bacterium]|nr:hypothetical protein [Chthoniobacterales bacterium]
MNRSCRNCSVIVFAIAVFITASAVAETPGSGKSSGGKLRRWTNLPWNHVDFPLFSLFGPFEHKPDVLAVAKAIRSKSAFDVYGFREVILADDDKGITIGLDDQDRRQLKTLAQKDKRRWFVAAAPPKDFFVGEFAVAVVYMTPSMADGQITFKHPECGSIARSLRRRFRIEEFRLTPR